MFYILSFTWGLPLTLFGCIVASILFLCGNRPKKYGWSWCFEFPDITWGIEMGVFFIAPSSSERVKMHEHGHGIQNVYLGIFNPLVVTIPSTVRYWYREFREAIGKPCKTKYDDAVLEESATETGRAFIRSLKYEKK